MFHLKPICILLSSVIGLSLSGCQSFPQGSEVIARTFNMTTNLQQKLLNRDAPTDVLLTENIRYQAQPNLNIDVYQPANIAKIGPRPTIVWVHGGGWISGSKSHAGGYFKRLAAQGYNVVAVQYQLAPDAVYPSQLLQINQALDFVSQNAASFHIDAQNLYLAGDSAGANLVSHYAALLNNSEFAKQSDFKALIQPNQVKGLILHCGIYDMAAFVGKASQEIGLVEWGIYHLVDAYTQQRRDDADFLRSISPSQHITSNYPAVFISGGNKDFLTETQSLPFVDILKQHQVAVTEVFYPDSKEKLLHEYQFFLSKKASQATFQKTLDFIAQYSH